MNLDFLPKNTLAYVAFERRVVERRGEVGTPTEGVPTQYEEDWVRITPKGTKDLVLKSVSDWFATLQQRVTMEMIPAEEFHRYQKQYEAWKAGMELPLEGTPIRGWPMLSLLQQEDCFKLHIRTVEDLANANQETIARLGMGALAMKQRAADWIVAKKDMGPVLERQEAQQKTLDALQKTLQELQAENRALKSLKGIAEPSGFVSTKVDAAPMSAEEMVDMAIPET